MTFKFTKKLTMIVISIKKLTPLKLHFAKIPKIRLVT